MPAAHRLLDHVLDARLVDEREHLLGRRLGGREEAGAEPGGGDDGLADTHGPTVRTRSRWPGEVVRARRPEQGRAHRGPGHHAGDGRGRGGRPASGSLALRVVTSANGQRAPAERPMPTYVYGSSTPARPSRSSSPSPTTRSPRRPTPPTATLRPVKKVFTPVGITFKGNGFYKTDSRGRRAARPRRRLELDGLLDVDSSQSSELLESTRRTRRARRARPGRRRRQRLVRGEGRQQLRVQHGLERQHRQPAATRTDVAAAPQRQPPTSGCSAARGSTVPRRRHRGRGRHALRRAVGAGHHRHGRRAGGSPSSPATAAATSSSPRRPLPGQRVGDAGARRAQPRWRRAPPARCSPTLHPGDFVVVDQLVDRTWGRADTFHDDAPGAPRGLRRSLRRPGCARPCVDGRSGRRDHRARRRHGRRDPGPALLAPGPSPVVPPDGLDVVNMTSYPEAVLAAEAGHALRRGRPGHRLRRRRRRARAGDQEAVFARIGRERGRRPRPHRPGGPPPSLTHPPATLAPDFPRGPRPEGGAPVAALRSRSSRAGPVRQLRLFVARRPARLLAADRPGRRCSPRPSSTRGPRAREHARHRWGDSPLGRRRRPRPAGRRHASSPATSGVGRGPLALVPAGALVVAGRRGRSSRRRWSPANRSCGSRLGRARAGPVAAPLAPGRRAVTVPVGDAPPPVAVGDRVDLVAAGGAMAAQVVARGAAVVRGAGAGRRRGRHADELPAVAGGLVDGTVVVAVSGDPPSAP